MKKSYIQPSMKAHTIKLSTIIAGSRQSISSGGSNSTPGAPKTAESKSFEFISLDDE